MRKLAWLAGAVLFLLVVAIALHFSDGRELAGLIGRARPAWLAVALLLQVATYLAQAAVFRGPPRTAGFPLPLLYACELSLAKLFVDQTLPLAGLSGTALVT